VVRGGPEAASKTIGLISSSGTAKSLFSIPIKPGIEHLELLKARAAWQVQGCPTA